MTPAVSSSSIHGTAARQNIETCVACHSERDCLACHSSQSGRRFNPHGPGFDAERMKRKNPQTCAACHGNAIRSSQTPRKNLLVRLSGFLPSWGRSPGCHRD
jgi:hypothetical protein